jgi:hypothetical protein
MHLYVIKRKYSNTFYTVRNGSNTPAIMAFPYAKPAKQMLKTILTFEQHKQPLVVERVDEDSLVSPCRRSLQPIILFTPEASLELSVSVPDVPSMSNTLYLERKFTMRSY